MGATVRGKFVETPTSNAFIYGQRADVQIKLLFHGTTLCTMQPIVTGGTDSDSEGEEEEGDDDDDDDDEVEPPKVLGDMLESLAGAVFMDRGMDLQAVWSCLGPLFEEKIGEIDKYFVNLMDCLPEGICINKGSLKG